MEREEVHPLHVRAGHWINAVTLFALLWTGFAIFANDRHFAWISRLLPNFVWSGLQMQGHATLGGAWHLGFAIVMVANALWFGVAAIRTGSWRALTPSARTWLRDAIRATIDELRLPREAMERLEYNGAQKLAYSGVMVLGISMIVTGLALWFRRQLPWLLAGLGGVRIVLPAHIVIATLLLAFVAIHLVQVMRAGFPTLLSMITGTMERRPESTRRGLAWSAAAIAALFAGFTLVRVTSGSSGVPSYLQWAVEHGDRQREVGVRSSAD